MSILIVEVDKWWDRVVLGGTARAREGPTEGFGAN